MVAAIGPILSAVGSIAGGVMGANAQSENNKQNEFINMMNFMLRQQERADMIKAAEEGKTMSREGTTDAAGNRTRYIPGQGWVTELSAKSKDMQSMQDREAARVLMQDLPARREQMQRNLKRQLGEGERADELMRQFDRTKVDPAMLESEMRRGALEGVGKEYDAMEAPLLKSLVRSGSSNIGGLLSKLAESRAGASSKALGGIPAAARQQAMQMEAGQKGQLANLYNMFASRAGAMPGVSYAPQNVEGAGNQFLGANKAGGAQSLSALMQAFGKSGGSLDYTSPDDYMAKVLVSGGSALGNVADAATGQREKDILAKAYNARYNTSGGLQL